MESVSNLLSIIASILAIWSICQNRELKNEIKLLKQQNSGDRNIQSNGNDVINSTGDNTNIYRR